MFRVTVLHPRQDAGREKLSQKGLLSGPSKDIVRPAVVIMGMKILDRLDYDWSF